ncbi:hypothetical protein OPV22_027761 [Ensete ventricosum]|uniref:Senescence regulator S40 n=1 Tax=Ensete ventricosum TaxID=4639 RepID=A0AAV8Q137_ENSVE|nr:hypothetical protein OPV22_027761 [Ensete ventricosum]
MATPITANSPLDMGDGDEDFEEEEVWAVVMERKEASSPRSRRGKDSSSHASVAARRLPTGARTIPRSATGSEASGRDRKQSSPVSIPDWSKVYGHGQGPSSVATGDEDGCDRRGGTSENDDDDDAEDDDRAPPHEWLAKKMARSQISSSSVCEGAGRTLKGRDLRKVRNAVLTKTGFLE